MLASALALMVSLVVSLSTAAGAQDHAGHTAASSATPSSAAPTAAARAPRDPALPPSEEQAKDQLSRSPRHGEYVNVPVQGSAPIRAWVAYPERKDKAGVVIVIHEVFGLSDWIRGVADQLAREGFVAVAPDLVSGKGPNGGGTDSAATRDDAVAMVRALTPEETSARIAAVRDWSVKLPAASGKWATIGFCWGGGQSFDSAASTPPPAGSVVYYGSTPEAAALGKVAAPVLGLYGGDDARITAAVAPTAADMKRLGKTYDPHVYEGAGHGFLRQQEGRDGANLRATKDAWPRTVAFLNGALK